MSCEDCTAYRRLAAECLSCGNQFDLTSVDGLAEHLYETAPNRCAHPAWHQLGEVTKSVWRERAQTQLMSEFA